MELRRELILTIALLIVVNALLALGAVALLARIGPAVAEVAAAGGDDVLSRVEATVTRLGSGGAWAAVALGFVSFLGSLGAIALLHRRILHPVEEIHGALEAARTGDQLRRAHVTDAPFELRAVAQAVNRMLDRRMTDGTGAAEREEEEAARRRPGGR